MNDLLQARSALLDGLAGPYALRSLAEDGAPPYFGLHTKAAVVDVGTIDKSKMAVPCVISTQDEDRYKDVVVTAGIDLTHHTTNPTVLMEHGRGLLSGKATTIARACDPDGQYTVKREKKRVLSVSWFTNKVRESEDAYALVEEGLLNGLSIGFSVKANGVKYREDHPDDYQGWPGLLFGATELREYSHCAIGVNPHCLVDRLQKSISGRAWSPHTLKSLAPYLPPLREQVTGGWVPDNQGEGKAVTITNNPPAPATVEAPLSLELAARIEKLVADAVAKAVPVAVPVAPAAPVATPAPAVPTTPATPTSTTDTDDMRDWPPGAKCLVGLHDFRMLENEYIDQQLKGQENEDVRLALGDVADANETLCGTLGEVWARHYADIDSPFEVQPAEGQEHTDEQRSHNEQVRARLQRRLATLKAVRDARAKQFAPTQSAKAALASASATLAEVASVAGLTEAQKAACVALSATVKGLADQPASGEDVEQLRAQNAQLQLALKTVSKNHEELQREVRRLKRGR